MKGKPAHTLTIRMDGHIHVWLDSQLTYSDTTPSS